MIRGVATGRYRAYPRIGLNVVDVRDVAPTITQALITVAVPERDVAVRSFHSDVLAGDTLFGSLDFRVTHGGHTVSMIGTWQYPRHGPLEGGHYVRSG